MPPFNVTNTGTVRLQVRDDNRGLVPLMPGRSDDFVMAASLARYYKGAGHTVTPDPDADDKADKGPAPVKVADLGAEDRVKIAEAEGINLGDTDPASDDAVAIINEFRTLYGSGTDAELRTKHSDVDFTGAKTKGDVVNAIIAARGVSG